MSACGPALLRCARPAVGCVVLIVLILLDLATGKNCSHPLIPEHGGFRCDPSPCNGFPHRSIIHYFCEPGFSIRERVPSSRCQRGQWMPRVPTCVSSPKGHIDTEDKEVQSFPSAATTAIGVSIFLLTTTACMVIKSRLYPCQSNSRRPSDQMDLMVDGVPISLPTYEEAVYGSWGQRLSPCQGPTQLLLAQETTAQNPLLMPMQPEPSVSPQSANQSTEQPPPPSYEEITLRSSGPQTTEGRALQIALSQNKDS